jgi:hypothetical protein
MSDWRLSEIHRRRHISGFIENSDDAGNNTTDVLSTTFVATRATLS